MATVTYHWDTVLLDWVTTLSTNTELPGSQTNPAVTALKDGSGFFAAWDQPGLELVDGRLVGGNVPLSPEYQLNSTGINDQFDPSLATLSNGNMVLTFTDHSDDPDGDIRARLFASDGAPVNLDFAVDGDDSFDDSDSDVASLADGGFVVTWTRNFVGDNNDIRARIFNSDGTPRTDFIYVDSDSSLNTSASQVIGLANGNFVVAWQQEPVAGGSTEVRYRIYDPNGNPITGSALIDAFGLINEDIQIVALQDGGFAVAYADSGWGLGANGTDITVRMYNADGSARTSFLRANDPDNGGIVAGDQAKPTLTVLSNGYIVVGWIDGAIMKYQAYDPAGNPIGTNNNALVGAIDGNIVGLAGGMLASVQQNAGDFDGSANSIVSHLSALIRNTMGNGTSEALAGDSLFDMIWGLGGNDTISGGAGNDTLEGGKGNDKLNGGSGVDMASYTAATAAVRIDLAVAGAQNTGGAGTDKLISIESTIGSAFNDTLKGNAQGNYIFGVDGDDLIEGRGGNDTLNGGSGNDTASYASAASGVTVSLGVFTAQNTGGAGTDLLLNIERLTGSRFNDVLTGDVEDNIIKGGDGRDSLDGGEGTDTLDGGSGKDTLDGGQDEDWASYASAKSGVTVNLDIQLAQDTGGGGIDRLIGIEHLIGSKFNDRLLGESGNNNLSGGAGKDTLIGGGGEDTLDGGAGNDVLNGGLDSDLASYASAGSGVTVSLVVATAQNTGGGGVDRLIGIEGLIGSKFNDRLTGDGGGNELIGGAGKDTLNGGGGDDMVEGGAGNDVMNGGAGTDGATYRLATSGVTVNLAAVGAQNTGGAGTDMLSNFEDLVGSKFGDTLTGNSLANLLVGGGGNDTMSGGDGNDTLFGGAGRDELTGGAGSDTFVYRSPLDSWSTLSMLDLITDFGAGDRIDLSAIDADSTTGGNQAFHLDGSTGGPGDIGVVFDAANNRTAIHLYVDNSGGAAGTIMLSGNHTGLTEGDFVL